MNKTSWIISDPSFNLVQALASELNINPLTAKVLINRGIMNKAQAESFLSPKLGHLSDPITLPDAEKAAKRVIAAINNKEKIVVYGDYDVDGVSAAAILVKTLLFLRADVSYYIPHRFGEGYSLSMEAIKSLKNNGCQLIITVDCGIASVEEIKLANELKIDVIVTDHHNIPEKLPPAFALVDPKLVKGDFAAKDISGAGVAFKFAWALLKVYGIKDALFLSSMLDLAALGTLADVVPLNQENRIFAVAGLKLINEKKRPGINALIEASGIKGKISEERVYFGLAPRINAAGRLEHASQAVELLLTTDQEKARELAKQLSQINVRRQDIGTSMQEQAFGQLNEEIVSQNKCLLLVGEGWHPGVIGIVASRISDKYYRPAVLIGINDGTGRGSARSIDGVNIYELLKSCQDLFIDFGGHEGAAGFEIDPKNIDELKQRLKIAANKLIPDVLLVPKLKIESCMLAKELTLSLIKELDTLAPFGEGNRPPLFAIEQVKITDMRQVGKNKKHLKLKLDADGVYIDAIGFSMGDMLSDLSYNNVYDIAFNLGANEWNGFEQVELTLVDIKAKEPK